MAVKRQFQFIDQSLTEQNIKWDRCVICQIISKEPLIIPTENGYTSLTQNLQEYAEFGSLFSHKN